MAISLLLDKIGNRDVVVDACLPPQLANDLRGNNVNAIWVPAILGDGASDDDIVRELMLEDRSIWGGSTNQKVLLTRDVEFYRRIQKKAILVNHGLAKHFRRDVTQQLDQKNLRKIGSRR